MANTNYTAVHALVLELITDNIIKVGKKPEDITEDTDLLQSGILDSFDFLDLIVAIEENSKLSVDLAAMDNFNVAVLGDFVRGIVHQNS